MANKEDTIIKLAKEKSQRRQCEVLQVIEEMRKCGEKISFYSVSLRANASKSYLYANEMIARKIREYRGNSIAVRSEESKDVLIRALQERNKKLQEENHALKEQLRKAYNY